jgi:SAM-dependent methyltransferase
VALDWDERHAYARDFMLPWVERVCPLAGKRVVEFGAGNGPVTTALCELGANVMALDIDAAAVEEGRRRTAECGLSAEFIAGPFETLIEAVASGGPVDVFFLFAVLEHMTVDERLSTLAAARDAIGAAGFLVVCETPNRLLPWDHHTSLLPFFGMLPADLALRYVDCSPRDDFRVDIENGLAQGSDVARERLARWGRPASYHEFELAFDDFPGNVVASSWDPALLPVREIHPEELALARLLKRVRPDIPPSFSRYWLDLVIAGTVPEERRYFEPWLFESTQSTGIDLTDSEGLLFREAGARLRVQFDRPTQNIVVGLQHHTSAVDLYVESETGQLQTVSFDCPEGGGTVYETVGLDQPANAVTLEASGRAILSFLGYERVDKERGL